METIYRSPRTVVSRGRVEGREVVLKQPAAAIPEEGRRDLEIITGILIIVPLVCLLLLHQGPMPLIKGLWGDLFPSGSFCADGGRGLRLGCLAYYVVLAAVLIPHFIKARDQRQLAVCTSNLGSIRMALVAYAADFAGRYPTDLARLSPKYLLSLPRCPANDSIPYSYTSVHQQGKTEIFTVVCGVARHQTP